MAPRYQEPLTEVLSDGLLTRFPDGSTGRYYNNGRAAVFTAGPRWYSMTEQEWLTSNNPQVMLHWLIQPLDLRWAEAAGRRVSEEVEHLVLGTECPAKQKLFVPKKPSDRKLRLWIFACRERNWEDVPEHTRKAIRAGYDLVDGKITEEQLLTVDAHYEGRNLASAEYDAAGLAVRIEPECPHSLKAALLREIVGNPFQPQQSIWTRCLPCGGSGSCGHTASELEDDTRCPYCRHYRSGVVPTVSWLTPTILALAQAAYQGRQEDGTLDADRLAVLGDALEDVGASGEILTHLRGEGPHVRGCWCLDLLLEKE